MATDTLPFGPSGATPCDYGCSPVTACLPSWEVLARPVRQLWASMTTRFQNIGFARRTGGVTAELQAATANLPTAERGLSAAAHSENARAAQESLTDSTRPPSPHAFIFRPSDVEAYLDLFTYAPLTRPATQRGTPRPRAPAAAVPSGQDGYRLPIDTHLRLATPQPTVNAQPPVIIPPPPGATYEEPEGPLTPPSTPSAGPLSRVVSVAQTDHESRRASSPSPSSSTESIPVCRLRPIGQRYVMEGTREALSVYKLEALDGTKPPPFFIHSGEPISICSLDGGTISEVWPVEALRFYPKWDLALIVVGLNGCPVLVETECFRVQELYCRAHAWGVFHRSLVEDFQREQHLSPFSLEARRRFMERARATTIWMITKDISHKTMPPEDHPAPNEYQQLAVELLAQDGLPGTA